MRDKIRSMQHVTLWDNTKSTFYKHDNNYIDDNVMRVIWILWKFILMSKPMIYVAKHDDKECNANYEHPSPRVWGYKRGSGGCYYKVWSVFISFVWWNLAPPTPMCGVGSVRSLNALTTYTWLLTLLVTDCQNLVPMVCTYHHARIYVYIGRWVPITMRGRNPHRDSLGGERAFRVR